MSSNESFAAELNRARQLQASGQARAAAGIYQQILGQAPDHYEANYSLGMLNCVEVNGVSYL